MANLAIFEGDREVWTQFDKDAEVLIRYINKEELRKITTKASKQARLISGDMSAIADRDLGRAAVKGWRKIEDHKHPGLMLKGKPLEFSQSNLDMLMQKSIEFSNFVNTNCVDAQQFVEAEEAQEDLKND